MSESLERKEALFDHALARSLVDEPLIPALAGEIPVVGAVVTYWGERVRSQRDQAQRAFLRQLVIELKEISEDVEQMKRWQLDRDHIWSGDFLSYVARATEEAARDTDEERREYLLRFVKGWARKKRPDVSLVRVFWDLIRTLGGSHLVVLDRVCRAQQALTDKELRGLASRPGDPAAVSIEQCATDLGMGIVLVEALVASLESSGLLVIAEGRASGADRSSRIVATPLGRRLMLYLCGEWTGKSRAKV